jgi:hypothetical protein
MASPNYSDIVSTTLRHRTPKLVDNVTANNALLARLKSRGKLRLVGGGQEIVEPLAYQENQTYKRYSGYETLDISPSDVITAAKYDWKQVAVAVTASGLELLQNSGKEQIIDLLEGRIEVAENTLMNKMSEDIYSDGTATNQINGLQALVADTNTNEVGGIDGNTWSFWRNYVREAAGTLSASTVQGEFNDVYVNITRGADHPDLIVCDNNIFKFYLASLQDIQRIQDPNLGQLGFQTLKFMQADVVLDGGYGGSAPATHAYFLNTKYLRFTSHRDRNFVPIGDEREPVNQDAMIKLIGWAGNLCCSNRFLQGVLKDASA